jgi:hypothetical protein
VHEDLLSISPRHATGRQSSRNSIFPCRLYVASAPPALPTSTTAITFNFALNSLAQLITREQPQPPILCCCLSQLICPIPMCPRPCYCIFWIVSYHVQYTNCRLWPVIIIICVLPSQNPPAEALLLFSEKAEIPFILIAKFTGSPNGQQLY